MIATAASVSQTLHYGYDRAHYHNQQSQAHEQSIFHLFHVSSCGKMFVTAFQTAHPAIYALHLVT